jgi:hypothetical protein
MGRNDPTQVNSSVMRPVYGPRLGPLEKQVRSRVIYTDTWARREYIWKQPPSIKCIFPTSDDTWARNLRPLSRDCGMPELTLQEAQGGRKKHTVKTPAFSGK